MKTSEQWAVERENQPDEPTIESSRVSFKFLIEAVQLDAKISALEEAANLIAETPVLVKHLPLVIELKNEIFSLATKLREGTK